MMSNPQSIAVESTSTEQVAVPQRSLLIRILEPLASLKLTVVLFAMAILVVLAGTLAQVESNINKVVDDYFRVRPSQLMESPGEAARALFVRIPTKIFFPSAFFPSNPTEKFNFTLPKGWVEEPAGAMQKAAFKLEGEDSPLSVSVSTAMGSLTDNVNRWRTQIDLPPFSPSEAEQAAKPLQVAGADADYFVLEGATETILGAVVQHDGKTWFLKARGPKEIVERERANFESFATSVSFPWWPSFWFPKGWLIGAVMLLNLLSAHLIRFKLQARGMQLAVGLWLLAVGGVVTWLVIVSGSNQDGFQTTSLISYAGLWQMLKWGLLGLGIGCAWLGVRTEREHHVERWLSWGAAGGLFVMFAITAVWGNIVASNDSSMRILYQLVKGIIAGTVLLSACLVLFRKRAGIVLLHGGVALMMISEVLVGIGAVETRMSLDEGQEDNSVINIQRVELAVIDRSDPKLDTVTVVPVANLNEAGKRVSDQRLPFDIKTVDFLPNSEIVRGKSGGEENRATQGVGLTESAKPLKPTTGVDSESPVDSPSAYVELIDKTGKSLGQWLVSTHLSPQTVSVDGHDYDLALRFEHSYLPYSLKLLDVNREDYIGTNTPQNYESTVVLKDPEKDSTEEVRIWMNNPLRYRGKTFYQSGYFQDPRTGRESTTLQIVSNNGWMIPYVSCMIVGVGMCYQFILTLLRFLNRWDRAGGAAGVVESVVAAEQPSAKRSRDDRVDAASERETRMWARWLPIVVCTVFGVYVLSKARPPRYAPNEPNLQAFGQLPVVAEGRIKPFDSLARNSLLLTSGRQDYRDKDGKKQPAIRWLLDTISGRPEAYDARVFRITNLEVLKLLKLEERSGFTYAWNELKPQLGVLQKELETLGKSESEERAVYRRGIGETAQKLSVFLKLGDAFDPVDPQLPTPEEMKSDPEAANAKLRSAMMTSIRTAQEIDRSDAPRAVPMPAESSSENAATTGEWKPLATELLRAFWQRQMTNSEPPEQLIKLETALNAYRQGRTDEFNAAVQDYSSWLKRESLPHVSLGSLKFEQFFNSFAPFYWSMVLCVFVFLLTMLSWLGFTEPLRRSAFWLMLLTFFLHTFALGARIYISGRPPVTNLYTTGIFIGWAVVLLGLGCEAIYRIGVGNAVASMAGFITLGISHVLMDGKDTFSVLQAVLDTGIWLGTHVVTINLGYAATAAAGLFGVYFTVYRLLASKPNPVVEKAVSRMMYGTLCFAILFSFIGTVLGGLWADDSWGRFWGWDPKENGALIIVLWNALVLHAKWDGMAKNRGMAVLTTLGLVAVSWSWFGTNQLGAGLHSYGFTDAARISLFAAWGITIVLAGLGCLPDRKRDLAA